MRLNTRAGDIMTLNPVCSPPVESVESVARLMADANCGEIPSQTAVREVMTAPPITVNASEPLRKEIELMEFERVRRVPVLDANGKMIGIISQVDIPARASQRQAGDMLARLQSSLETRALIPLARRRVT